MSLPETPIRARLDRAGIVLSSLCALHCVAGLLLVGALGIGGEVILAPAIHRIGLALAIVIGAVTIGYGVSRHGKRDPLYIGSAGLALMAGGLVVPHGLAESALTVPGVVLVAIAHIRNLRALT